MKHPEIFFLDVIQGPCPVGACENLPLFVKDRFPTARIHSWSAPSSILKPARPTILILRHALLPDLPEVVKRLRSQHLDVPMLGVLCEDQIPGHNRDSLWLNSLDDFTCCPVDHQDLTIRIQRLLRLIEMKAGSKEIGLATSNFRVAGLVGESRCFLEAMEKIPQMANSDAPALIFGETGTGKELFARAVHYNSPRKGRPFVPVNCGALPDHLFENELFGHKKGAFTDAWADQKGLVQEAEGGTLFLDEVESLSAAGQTKLLRFLQGSEYRPLGGSKNMVANVRILAATNRDLRGLVEEGKFRDDLYYRLNILPLPIPPLRERLDDIPRLVTYFLRQANKFRGGPVHLEPDAMSRLLRYPWPGNVRELESVVHRIMTFSQSQAVKADDIDLPSQGKTEGNSEFIFRQAKSEVIDNFERTYLINLLTAHQGNISHAAKAAGKERRAFKRLLTKHRLDRKGFLASTC